MALQEDRARLMAHFAGEESEHRNKWSALWNKGDFLPWDRGMPNPALEDTLVDRTDLLGSCYTEDAIGRQRRKRAFVPGCGKGYDVLLLASFGYDAYGLEISETAVNRCVEEQKIHGHNYPVRDQSVGAGKVSFFDGDFFSNKWMIHVEGDGKLDLIYDYQVDFHSCIYACDSILRFVYVELSTADAFRYSSSQLSHQVSDLNGRFVCRSFWPMKEILCASSSQAQRSRRSVVRPLLCLHLCTLSILVIPARVFGMMNQVILLKEFLDLSPLSR